MTSGTIRGGLLALLLLWPGAASAQIVTWTFTGEITNGGVFSTLPPGSTWALSIDFDPSQTPTVTGFYNEYVGDAVFLSGVDATDTQATIRIADSPNQLTISLEDAGADLPQLEFTNLPGTFGQVDRISVSFSFDGIGSQDINDYLTFDLPADPAARTIAVVVPSAISPTGVVADLEVDGVPPVPTGPLLPWMLAPIGVALAGWRLRVRSADEARAADA